MKPTLKHVTCTGIDRSTDLDRLAHLQELFPLAEFGVLMSATPQNSPRFPGTAFLPALRGLGLNLSLHLCGMLAREAAAGNWRPTTDLLEEDMNLFRRIQLNIGGYTRDVLPEKLAVTIPDGISEVIIQQRDADSASLFLDAAWKEPRLSVLLDASGGRGVYGTPVKGIGRRYKTGFAGGYDRYTIHAAIPAIVAAHGVGEFWVDAESRLRNVDDTFSIHRATMFLDATLAAYHNA